MREERVTSLSSRPARIAIVRGLLRVFSWGSLIAHLVGLLRCIPSSEWAAARSNVTKATASGMGDGCDGITSLRLPLRRLERSFFVGRFYEFVKLAEDCVQILKECGERPEGGMSGIE